MPHFDIFNGDADGIFALHQMRMETPQSSSVLITGVKRDITLLSHVADRKDSSISVFDISLDSNRQYLDTLLSNNNSIEYFDHHFAGTIPDSPLLQYEINVSPESCTSLIVNNILNGKNFRWAICGAFGDNLHRQAEQLANDYSLTEKQTLQLREIGELFNYNGYGSTLSDLHFHPEELYRSVHNFENPFDFIISTPIIETLREGFNCDLGKALNQKEYPVKGKHTVYYFPNAAWARRIQGIFSNLKAREEPDIAHALIVENDDLSLRISLRAPLTDKRDADSICKLFPTGGGRAAAAGINSLPPAMLDDFLIQLNTVYR